MKWYRISYQKRLLTYLLLGGLLPLLLASAMILYATDSVYENRQVREGRAAVEQISCAIDGFVVHEQHRMDALSVRPETIAFLRGTHADTEDIHRILSAFQEECTADTAGGRQRNHGGG